MRIETPTLARGESPDPTAQNRETPNAAEDQRPVIPDTLSILPIRDLVLFPGIVLPLTVSRGASRKLLEESLPQSKVIGLFTQKDPHQDEPGPDGLHRVGVAALVLKLIRQPDETVIILVNALERIAIRKILLAPKSTCFPRFCRLAATINNGRPPSSNCGTPPSISSS
jgi:ATP-dependent Lon protease